jgi:hypothetical protein
MRPPELWSEPLEQADQGGNFNLCRPSKPFRLRRERSIERYLP